jgi:peroxiredoxin Q/BCP
MIEDGQKAPDFRLADETGALVQLSKLKGRAVVLYFYPKDDTSGCTQEAKDFSCLS